MTLTKIEGSLDEYLNKKLPVKLPSAGRKGLAESLWLVALVVGVLQLLAAYGLWQAGHVAGVVNNTLQDAAQSYGMAATTQHLGLVYYLTFVSMAAVAFLLLVASPGLKAMHKDGWNLLFNALIIQVISAVLLLFADYGGFGNFVVALLSAVVGVFLLFQVREYFKKAPHA